MTTASSSLVCKLSLTIRRDSSLIDNYMLEVRALLCTCVLDMSRKFVVGFGEACLRGQEDRK